MQEGKFRDQAFTSICYYYYYRSNSTKLTSRRAERMNHSASRVIDYEFIGGRETIRKLLLLKFKIGFFYHLSRILVRS